MDALERAIKLCTTISEELNSQQAELNGIRTAIQDYLVFAQEELDRLKNV